MPYVNSQGVSVTDAEALGQNGVLKSGYRFAPGSIVADGETVTFSSAFMDSGSRRFSFTDSAPAVSTPAVDAEVYRAVGRSRAQHIQRHAYLGDRAPAFTDAMAGAAASQFTAHKRAVADASPAASILDAVTVTARHMKDEAAAQRKDALRNAWRN